MSPDPDPQTEIAALEARIAELKRLQEEKITIKIHKLNTQTNKVYITLSKFHSTVVDYIRNIPGRYYSGDDNVISCDYLDEFTTFISALSNPNLELIWEKKSFDVFEAWKNAPDCYVDINKSWVTLKFGRKYANRSMWLSNDISTYTQDAINKEFKFAVAELYKFPNSIYNLYPTISIVYSPTAEKELFNQLDHRKQIADLANALDTPLDNPFSGVDKNGIPYDLKGHQRVAVKFAELSDNRAIIAYDMGTGKTFCAAGLAERHPEWKRVLVICPASLKTNWKREIKKTTNQDAIVLSGTEPDALSIELLVDNKSRYYIINFDIIGRKTPDKIVNGKVIEQGVMKWVELFNILGVDLIIIDEAHYVKNTESKRSQGVRALKSTAVIPMTGTPIVNRPLELWPLLNIVAPNVFPSITQFASQFTDGKGRPRNTSKLHELMLPYMIRRTRKDVYGELHVEMIPFTKDLSGTARALYNKILEGVYISLRKPDYIRNVTSILAQLMRCKQTCSADNIQVSAELAMDAYEDTQKKVIITSQFKESQYAIQNILGTSCVVVNGDTGDDTRYELMDKFQDPGSNIKYWVTNIPEGLTLTEAHTVIHNDLWWTPKDHKQLEGRAFGRDNDPHGGNAYYIQNENTIDQLLVELLTRKQQDADEVVDGIRASGDEQGSIISQLINHLREGI